MEKKNLRQRNKESIYLAVCVSLQAFLISILYHLSDLLNEWLPLTLQDKLTLDLDKHKSKRNKVRVNWVCLFSLKKQR